MDEPEFKQLKLFNTTEKEEFERNINSLKVIVEQIPVEIEREVAAIQAKFANAGYLPNSPETSPLI